MSGSVYSASEHETVTSVAERKLTGKEKFIKGVKDNLFTILTLVGVIIGFGIGLGVGTTKPTAVTIDWISKLIPFFQFPCMHLSLLLLVFFDLPITKEYQVNELLSFYLEMPGVIYIRLLQLTILPIISANIIVGKLSIL